MQADPVVREHAVRARRAGRLVDRMNVDAGAAQCRDQRVELGHGQVSRAAGRCRVPTLEAIAGGRLGIPAKRCRPDHQHGMRTLTVLGVHAAIVIQPRRGTRGRECAGAIQFAAGRATATTRSRPDTTAPPGSSTVTTNASGSRTGTVGPDRDDDRSQPWPVRRTRRHPPGIARHAPHRRSTAGTGDAAARWPRGR